MILKITPNFEISLVYREYSLTENRNMFNPFKAKENKKSDKPIVCHLSGTIKAVLIDQGPTFQMTLVESGLVWELTYSQLCQLLLHSYDENDKGYVTDDTRMIITEDNTFRGSFPVELLLMQFLGFSVSVIDSHFYARCPGAEDFYFTVRHAAQIPGIQNYREIHTSIAAA